MRHSEQKYMDADEFVELAKAILGDATDYEDELVKITRNAEAGTLALEVTRKPREDAEDHLRVSNPTTMVVNDGEIIRHHGEHAYLVPHMERLAANAAPAADNSTE